MRHYLGLDSGSVSLKAVIINEKGKIIKSAYIKNYNLMITLKQILNEVKVDEKIYGVGVTGTGQEFISKMVGADITEPEIIAHSTAALKLFPDVQTILDIGGQDSKLIVVKEKILRKINFNELCGAGTGGIIELIASELDVKLNDVGRIALESKNDFPFAGKCGVFARSSVVDRKNKGVDRRDILMGVCKALVHNYFAILSKGVRLRPPYVFQGATAKNIALVKCMENELQCKVNIPEHPHLMGAYGIALIALEDFKGETKFKGFDIANSDFKAKTFIAKGCSNNCEITEIYEDDKKIGCIGNRCEKCVNH